MPKGLFLVKRYLKQTHAVTVLDGLHQRHAFLRHDFTGKQRFTKLDDVCRGGYDGSGAKRYRHVGLRFWHPPVDSFVRPRFIVRRTTCVSDERVRQTKRLVGGKTRV